MVRWSAEKPLLSALAFQMTSRLSAFSPSARKVSIQRAVLLTTSAHPNNHVAESPMFCLPATKGRPIRSVLAPMVAASDYPFRCLVRQHSRVDLTFTQMLHSRRMLDFPSFIKHHDDFFECQPFPDTLIRSQEKIMAGMVPSSQPPCPQATTGPLIVQLAGHCVSTVTDAAQLILDRTPGVAGVDLNLGCPQTIARKGRYGAFLMEEEPETVYRILHNLRDTLPRNVAVSAKIRLPLDPSVQADRIHRLRDTGIDFLTVHGRDLTENKVNNGSAHWDRLRLAVQAAGPSLPVVANGGVEFASDIDGVISTTGAAAVMSSEALLERPNLLLSETKRNSFSEQIALSRSYLDWCRYAPPLPGVLPDSFGIVKGHLFKFLYPYLQVHTDLRDQLSGVTMESLPQAYAFLEELKDREWDESMTDATTSWYRRHRRAIRLHIQQRQQLSSKKVQVMSVAERKDQIRGRIAKMRAKRIHS